MSWKWFELERERKDWKWLVGDSRKGEKALK